MVGIKSIFFDLFGVLIGMNQSTIINHIAKLTNQPYLKTKEIVTGEIFMRLERGEIGFKQYFQDLQYALPNGQKLSFNKFKTLWTTNKLNELPAVELLDSLKEKYSLHIISNTSESHISDLKSQFIFLSKFDCIITSESAQSQKPSTDIFNYALSKTQALPEQSVFIDDMHTNVTAASSLGFHAHHYRDYEEFSIFMDLIL